MRNVDANVADGFGREWSTFKQDHSALSAEERLRLFEQYFRIFPWNELPEDPVGLDAGCGSGRWATLAAPRVGHLHLLDASPQALAIARDNLSGTPNVTFHAASVSDIPLAPESLDFAYSLGVLHHVPDTLDAIRHIASKLRPGAPFLIYLYYALDNRPLWFRTIWWMTNVARLLTARMPHPARLAVSTVIAVTIYWPLARLSALVSRAGRSTHAIPLEAYKDRSFYTMRTDAYDRFCTPLEKRFTREEIAKMLLASGFERIRFSDEVPFWCAVGYKTGKSIE